MVPIQNIVDRDRRCVDLRTSAWIMGKLLKLNAFTHSIGVSIGNFGPTNILLEPNEHYVVIFDCSDAITSDSLPEDVKRANIAQSAKSVIYLLGCDMETKLSMEKITEEMQPYVDMLFYLASVQQSNANIAHQRFYELVDQIWERKFYPFTTIEI